MAVLVLQALLLISAATLVAAFVKKSWPELPSAAPKPVALAIGAVANFFDTLGIGSFAPTTAAIKALRLVPDENLPGTLNVGHAIPTMAQALIFIALIKVDIALLLSCIAAAILGALLGARLVSRMSRRAVGTGIGAALIVASGLLATRNLGLMPGGGEELALSGAKFAIAVGLHFLFGALMTLGVGLYAPALITLSLLGMEPRAAFPIMMGACAFLMPAASLSFIRSGRYAPAIASGFALGGTPAVLLAAYVVKELPLDALRWLVAAVVFLVGSSMLWGAASARMREPATN